jgi:hypothetical protein
MTDERGPRERAYDEHIAPLMGQIIAACKAHGIPFVASFELELQAAACDGGPMYCTSIIVPASASPHMRGLARAARPQRVVEAFAETIETLPDGGKRTTLRRVT